MGDLHCDSSLKQALVKSKEVTMAKSPWLVGLLLALAGRLIFEFNVTDEGNSSSG